jgi:hypothetical protein
MGMCLGLTTLGDVNVARVLADPPLIWRVIAPDDPEPYEHARRENAPSLLGKIFGRKPSHETQDLLLDDSEGITTDLDKAWHGLHYLFTGSADSGDLPWCFLVAGGRTIGNVDVGYGPARVFSSAETKDIRTALSKLQEDELRTRFNPSDMTAKDIYPEIWSRGDPDEETIGYLLEQYSVLQGFLEEAVAMDVGIVVYLT